MTASPPAPVSPLQAVLADAGGGILETEVVRCPREGMALSEATILLMWGADMFGDSAAFPRSTGPDQIDPATVARAVAEHRAECRQCGDEQTLTR